MFNVFKRLQSCLYPFLWLSVLYVPIFAANSSTSAEILQQTSGLRPEVLKAALKAHDTAMRLHETASAIATIVDFSLPSGVKRMWVINTETGKVLYNTWVTHGSSSGSGAISNNFSNKANSHASSIGVYKTGATYNGNNGYSLHLFGLDKGFNDNAYNRSVVVHGADYASSNFIKVNGFAGHSWGCFAVAKELNKEIIDTIKDNSILVAYYPNQQWLHDSKYL